MLRDSLRGESPAYRLTALGVLIPATALALLLAGLSLRWDQVQDTPLFTFIAHAVIDDGKVPYRDIFDPNLPGTYAVYGLIVAVLGTSDLAIRVGDLACLGIVAASAWLIMRRIDPVAGWAAAAIFALLYLSQGSEVALQRDFILLVPISLAALCASRQWGSVRTKFGVIGLFLGYAAMVKPHGLLGAAPIIWYATATQRSDGGPGGWEVLRRGAGWLALGFATPVAAFATYLLSVGSLDDLVSMMRHYWPLYAHINETGSVRVGWGRLSWVVEHFQLLGGHAIWLVPGALGIFVAWMHRDDRRRRDAAIFLALMTLAFALYVAASGQFFEYHWLPFRYFAVLLAALCFVRYPAGRPGVPRHVAAAILVPFLLSPLMHDAVLTAKRSVTGLGSRAPWYYEQKLRRVDAVASYLRANLRPGDTVQPFDWVEGAVHAMLRADAELATPYMYNLQFFHDVSNPYIQGLRRRFVEDLVKADPRFVIELPVTPGLQGTDTTREFPAFQAVLHRRYRIVATGDGYLIWERRPEPRPGG